MPKKIKSSLNSWAFYLISVFLFTCALAVKGQSVAYYRVQRTDTLYVLNKNVGNKRQFFFPGYGIERELTTAVEITQNGIIPLIKKTKDSVPTDHTVIIRLFSQNIKSVQLLSEGSACSTPKTIEIKKDGYQYPVIYLDSCIRKMINSNRGVSLSFRLTDEKKPFKLLIGQLLIVHQQSETNLSPSIVFQQPSFLNWSQKVGYSNKPFESYGIFQSFPSDQKDEDFKGSLLISDKGKSETAIIGEVLPALIAHYPFYNERKIDKGKVEKRLNDILRECKNLDKCALIDTLNNYLSQCFRDPHFTIRSECHVTPVFTPVYTYRIKGKVVVAAILDDEIRQKLTLGDQLVAIDSIAVEKTGDRDYNTVLKREPGKTASLIVIDSNGKEKTISYIVKNKYTIPPNYNINNFTFKYLDDQTAYYKINRIAPQLPLDFFGKLDSINQKKRLIVDLRGNGGGDFLSGAQFLTYFIDKPFKYFEFRNIITNRTDPVVVRQSSSPVKYRSDGELILLIDESTACVAELMAYNLKAYYPHVKIVGKSPTRGALAFLYEINVQSKSVVIANNCMDTGKIYLDGRTLETTGIKPDLLVDINNVSDLQPYNDKVLKTALFINPRNRQP
jgi:C-terminal processing protease CtpA/Prc